MNDIIALVVSNLEKVGIGAGLFLGAYIANILLGIWTNVKIEGYDFQWNLILQSIVKFIIMGLGLAFLSVVVSIIPVYITYVGIDVGAETLDTIDSLVIVGSFMTATIRYVGDAINKIKNVLGN